jgi:outer membrane murein-binding lipoprotein Lpp
MNRPRAPYARRSVWAAIAVLAIVLVVGCVVAGYEINHLRNQVSGLSNQVSGLQNQVTLLYKTVTKGAPP